MSVQVGSHTSSVLEHAAPLAGTNSYKSKNIKSTMEALEVEAVTSVTAGMVGRHLRLQKTDDWDSHVESYAKLPSLILACQDADKSGVYQLNVKPLTYGDKLNVEEPSLLAGAMEFESVTIFPSWATEVFQFSSRIVHLDCAHMRTIAGGSFMSLSLLDNNNQNWGIGFSIHDSETKKHYDESFDLWRVILPLSILVLITDKFTGLQKRITSTNAAAASISSNESRVAAHRDLEETDLLAADAIKDLARLQEAYRQICRDRSASQESRVRVKEEVTQASEKYERLLASSLEKDEALNGGTASSNIVCDTFVLLVWICCVIHAARNQAITGKKGVALAVKCAKAPNEEALDYYKSQLELEVGSSKTGKFMKHKETWSVVSLMKGCNMETSLDQVHTNTAEQGNNTFMDERHMPLVDFIFSWLTKHAAMLRQRQQIAKQQAAFDVVQVWRLVVVNLAIEGNKKWDVTITTFDYALGAVEAVAVPRSGRSGVRYAMKIDITQTVYLLAENCTCGGHRSTGMPCKHLAVLMYYFRRKLEKFLKHGVPTNWSLEPFGYHSSKFYHSAKHRSMYDRQYAADPKIPTVNVPLAPSCVFPPMKDMVPGKQKKKRATKADEFRRSSSSSSSSGAASERASASVTNDGDGEDEDGDGEIADLPLAIREERVAQQQKAANSVRKCTNCGRNDHILKFCWSRTTATELASRRLLLTKLLNYTKLSTATLDRLTKNARLPDDIPRIHDFAIANHSNDDNQSDDDNKSDEKDDDEGDDGLFNGNDMDDNVINDQSIMSEGEEVEGANYVDSDVEDEENQMDDEKEGEKEDDDKHDGSSPLRPNKRMMSESPMRSPNRRLPQRTHEVPYLPGDMVRAADDGVHKYWPKRSGISWVLGTVVSCDHKKVKVQWNEDAPRRGNIFDVDHDDIDLS